MRVLVVDDEQVITDTLSIILTQDGYEVMSAYRAATALAAAGARRPDAAVIDVMMPEMNGIELAIRLREIAPECRILLLSGQAATGDLLTRARERGHEFEVLPKPLHPRELLNLLDQHRQLLERDRRRAA